MKLAKSLLLIASLLLSVCVLAAQDDSEPARTDRTNYGFHGPLHTLLTVRTQVNPDPRDPTERRISYSIAMPWLVFDTNGWMIEWAGQVVDGKPQGATTQKRDADGNVVEEGSRTESEGNCDREEVRHYRNAQLVSHEVKTYNVGGWDDQMETFDDQGRRTSESNTTYLVPVTWADAKAYSADGAITLHWGYRNDDATKRIDFFVYDPAGRLVLTYTAVKTELISQWHDPQWKQGAPTNVWTQHFHYSVTFAFYQDAQLYRTVEHHEGRKDDIDPDDAQLFDASGNLLESIRYSYTRDRHGNWTGRSVLIWDKKTNAMVEVERDTRTLTYY